MPDSVQLFNLYCDESCHLEHDQQRIMVLGAVTCPAAEARRIARSIRVLKDKHGLARNFEIKWSKVSPAKMDFYRDLIDLFFEEKSLRFRALVVADKSRLRHEDYDQDHDTWYYKMYYYMLLPLLRAQARFRIYLDIKDTRSEIKVQRLGKFLRSHLADGTGSILENIQQIRSHEAVQMQLADLLIGLVGYRNRGLDSSAGKRALVDRFHFHFPHEITRSTSYGSSKVNIFVWSAEEAR